MKFGDGLRALLEERNITQRQLANHMNIAPSTIGGYVQNSSEPDFDTLKRLAAYFDVSLDFLLDYRADKTQSFQEDDLLRVFRSMTAEQRELYLEQGKVFLRLNFREREKEKSS